MTCPSCSSRAFVAAARSETLTVWLSRPTVENTTVSGVSVVVEEPGTGELTLMTPVSGTMVKGALVAETPPTAAESCMVKVPSDCTTLGCSRNAVMELGTVNTT